MILKLDYLFLNFLLNPTKLTRPEPTRSMMDGSGMGALGSGNPFCGA
jgi:hypothetical protein